MELVVIDSTHIGMSKSAPLAHVGRELARRLSLQSIRKKSSWLTPLALPKYTPPRMPHVRRQLQGAPHMRRITLGGAALAGFPPDSDGAHIKLLLPRPGHIEPVLPTLGADGSIWPSEDIRPIARTYTVSRFDVEAG